MPVEQTSQGGKHRRVERPTQHRTEGRHRHDPSRPESHHSSLSPRQKLVRFVGLSARGHHSTGNGETREMSRTAALGETGNIISRGNWVEMTKGRLRYVPRIQKVDSMIDPFNETENKALAEKREKIGCTARAVESAFGVPVTPTEMADRLNDYNDLVLYQSHGVHTDREIAEKDIELTEAFYRRLQNHNVPPYETPIGKEMSKYTLSVGFMTPTSIKEALAQEKIVLLVGEMIEAKQRGENYKHIAHIEYDKMSGKFIRRSDKDASQTLPDASYRCFVFDRKPDVAS